MKRPILYCAISFCAGISLAHLLNISLISSIIPTIILTAVSIIFSKKNIVSHIALYLALIFFGAAYYQNYNILPANHISNYISDGIANISLKGVVIDDPATKKAFYGKQKISFVMRGDSMDSPDGWRKVEGLVRTDVYAEDKSIAPAFGDEVIIKGKLSSPAGLKNPGLFDYSKYLAIKNIYAQLTASGLGSINIGRAPSSAPYYTWNGMQRAAYKFRRRINDSIDKFVDRRYSGFVKAILTGVRGDLDNSVMDDFIKTGTVHVIAISGLNIALIAGIFIFLFKAFGVRKKLNLTLTSLLLIFYCFVAGASPPVVRATIMFFIVSLGYLVDRESDILNSLAIAAFVILIANPKELFDPSFQLSFASILGIVLFVPKVETFFGPKSNYFTKSAAMSMAAIISVSPIVARYFNIISPMALIANLVIVPALFVITIASFIFLTCNFLGLGLLSVYTGQALSLLSQATFYINHIFAETPLSYIRVPAPSPAFLALYYAFIFAFLLVKRISRILIALLLILNFAVWGNIFARPAKELKITYLDVGKGDSILLEFPDKGAMLIDGGSGGIDANFDIGRNVVAPYLWNRSIRRLDAVVITHFHEDHMGGLLYILKNFDIGCVMDNGIVPQGAERLYDEYRGVVSRKGIRRVELADGDRVTSFDGVSLYVLNPPADQVFTDANDNSIVIKLEYKSFSALFCGDISSNAMERILSYGDLLRSDVLKIPHHGGSVGKSSVAYKFYRQISPEAQVTSSGGKDYNRHKVSKGGASGQMCYDTKTDGAITVITKSDSFNIKSFCQNN